MTIYSLDVLIFKFGTSPLFYVWFCCFLTCIQVFQVGKMLWYSHLFKNFPQFILIHTVRVFSAVNEAEVDIFLEFFCFFCDPEDVGNLISGSSAFSNSSLQIWKFLVHVLMKPILENFEHCFTSVWDECNCAVVRTFFGIAFLLGLECKLTVATAQFSNFAGILNARQRRKGKIYPSECRVPGVAVPTFGHSGT